MTRHLEMTKSDLISVNLKKETNTFFQPRATARKYATGSGSFFPIVGKVKLSYSWVNPIFDRQLKEQSEDSSIGWK